MQGRGLGQLGGFSQRGSLAGGAGGGVGSVGGACRAGTGTGACGVVRQWCKSKGKRSAEMLADCTCPSLRASSPGSPEVGWVARCSAVPGMASLVPSHACSGGKTGPFNTVCFK